MNFKNVYQRRATDKCMRNIQHGPHASANEPPTQALHATMRAIHGDAVNKMNEDKVNNDTTESEKPYVSIAEMRYQTPERTSVRLLPWLMIMLTLIAAAGFWLQYDAWMDNRWFRSTAINLGINLQMRDKDWQILPGSVRPNWITRTDGSKALTIKGEIQNLLSSDMLAPNIELTFFSNIAPDQILKSQQLAFRHPPSELVMLQSPYQTPNRDNKPIPALGKREFLFLIDALPQGIGDFSLKVKTR